jgi:excisionase family DNA binding protein
MMVGLYGPSAIADLYCSLKNMPTDPTQIMELLTIPEVAEFLKISVPSVRRLQQRRLIPFFKIGGSVRFNRSDLASFLESTRVEAIGSK